MHVKVIRHVRVRGYIQLWMFVIQPIEYALTIVFPIFIIEMSTYNTKFGSFD